MQSLISKKAPTIHGDGGQTRDFTYVENAVQANIRSFFAEEKAINNVYNIAFGDRISLNVLWDDLQEISNSKLSANYGPTRRGDVRDSLADISKAKNLLGYHPLFSVKEGMEVTWEWFLGSGC